MKQMWWVRPSHAANRNPSRNYVGILYSIGLRVKDSRLRKGK